MVFVHGCFWHGHRCPRGDRVPKTNTDYWIKKVDRNRSRDASHLESLEKLGWSALTLWECELKDASHTKNVLTGFLAEL